MAARALATATISFGMVSIPIKLYSTSQTESAVSFNLLHKDCGTRLKQHYVCPKHDTVVPRDEMVKGYEFAKGQYVTFTPDELKALEAEATGAIEIVEFVPMQSIDWAYLSKAYFVGTDKGSARAFGLLCAAMDKTGRVAIAKYAARGKQYLVMVRPHGDGMVMQELHYADEVRSSDEVPVEHSTHTASELKLAVQLVDQIASKRFDPTAYRDEVRDHVLEKIEKKIEGQEIIQAPAKQHDAKIIDLMEALKASLGETGPLKRKPIKQAAKTKAPARTKKGA